MASVLLPWKMPPPCAFPPWHCCRPHLFAAAGEIALEQTVGYGTGESGRLIGTPARMAPPPMPVLPPIAGPADRLVVEEGAARPGWCHYRVQMPPPDATPSTDPPVITRLFAPRRRGPGFRQNHYLGLSGSVNVGADDHLAAIDAASRSRFPTAAVDFPLHRAADGRVAFEPAVPTVGRPAFVFRAPKPGSPRPPVVAASGPCPYSGPGCR